MSEKLLEVPFQELKLPNQESWVTNFDTFEIINTEKGQFAVIEYNPKLTEKDKDLLKVANQMPFKLVARINELDLTLIESPEFQTRILSGLKNELLNLTNINIFWHGFAGTPDVWNQDFINQITAESDAISVIPYGLGMGEKKDTPYKDIFTPNDYGDQMVGFMEKYFPQIFENNSKSVINLFGHSFGGIGILWAANVIDSRYDLKMNIFSFAPAYPSKANIFLTEKYFDNQYQALKAKLLESSHISANIKKWFTKNKDFTLLNLLELSVLIPSYLRKSPIGKMIYSLIHKRIIPSSDDERSVHEVTAANMPKILVSGAKGLLLQKELPMEVFKRLAKIYNLIIFVNPLDQIVSSSEFLDSMGMDSELPAYIEEGELMIIHNGAIIIINPVDYQYDHYLKSMKTGFIFRIIKDLMRLVVLKKLNQ